MYAGGKKYQNICVCYHRYDTSTGTFTADKAGLYHFEVHLLFDDAKAFTSGKTTLSTVLSGVKEDPTVKNSIPHALLLWNWRYCKVQTVCH